MPPPSGPAVLVYRDHLLPRSEAAFMRRQYMAFATLRPLWVTRRLTRDHDPRSFPPALRLGLAYKLLGHVPPLPDLGAIVVHAQFGRGGALALPLARHLRLPLVVTLHGGEVSKSAHWRPFALLRRRLPALAAYATAFVCVSQAVHDQAIARGFPPEKLVILPIGTDTLAQPPRDTPGEGILFVGRFVEMKGLAPLLDAVALLRASGLAAPVTLIGDGPDAPALRPRAEALGIALPGWQPQAEVHAAMRRARLLALPSIRARSGEAEGLPSVAAEAMGLALPVVATTAANTAGLLDPEANGLLVPPADPPALANAMARLLSDPALSLRLGQAARARVAQGFHAATQSARLERLLLAAAAAPPGTPIGAKLDFAVPLG